jgi:DNA primase
MPEQIGRVKKDIWLFGNMAIKDGKVYKPDSDGIIWIDGRGYKPQSLEIGPRGEPVEDVIPSISERPINIQEIAEKLRHCIGGYEAYMMIGWVIATIFSQDIFEKYKCVPILFPHGKRESGKSTAMRWIMNFFGIETEGISVGKTTTQNYIARALSYYNSLGVWFDEYRNESGVIEKDGLFRSAYNRQVSGKGTASAFNAKGFSVHASLAISGEELPRDNGLFTRCIPLQISSYKRNRQWFDWINQQASQFSNFTLQLILNYDSYKPKIMESIAGLKSALIKKQVTDRTAENWAICAGAFWTVVDQDAEFIKWVERSCQEIKKAGEEDHMLNQFWDDVNFLVNEGDIQVNYFKIKDNLLFIPFNYVFQKWGLHYKRKTNREPFDEQSIRKYLSDEPYYVDTKQEKFYTKGFPGKRGEIKKRGVWINLEYATDAIMEISQVVIAKQEEGIY